MKKCLVLLLLYLLFFQPLQSTPQPQFTSEFFNYHPENWNSLRQVLSMIELPENLPPLMASMLKAMGISPSIKSGKGFQHTINYQNEFEHKFNDDVLAAFKKRCGYSLLTKSVLQLCLKQILYFTLFQTTSSKKVEKKITALLNEYKKHKEQNPSWRKELTHQEAFEHLVPLLKQSLHKGIAPEILDHLTSPTFLATITFFMLSLMIQNTLTTPYYSDSETEHYSFSQKLHLDFSASLNSIIQSCCLNILPTILSICISHPDFPSIPFITHLFEDKTPHELAILLSQGSEQIDAFLAEHDQANTEEERCAIIEKLRIVLKNQYKFRPGLPLELNVLYNLYHAKELIQEA